MIVKYDSGISETLVPDALWKLVIIRTGNTHRVVWKRDFHCLIHNTIIPGSGLLLITHPTTNWYSRQAPTAKSIFRASYRYPPEHMILRVREILRMEKKKLTKTIIKSKY